MNPGDTFHHTRRLSQADFDRFAALSGDDNPIHVDPAYAARTHFGRTVAHGMLLTSHVGRLLAAALPGSRLRSLALMFPNPTFADDTIIVRADVTAVYPTHATLAVTVTRADGQPGLQGKAHVQPADTPTAAYIAIIDPSAYPLPSAADPSAYPLPSAADPSAYPLPSAANPSAYPLPSAAAARTRTFTPADLAAYANLVGDEELAGRANPPLPAGLLGGLFSCLLGTQLPGRGTNWLKQSLYMDAPAYAGQPITAIVEVVRLRPEKHLVNLRGACTTTGATVCTGESLVLAQNMPETGGKE